LKVDCESGPTLSAFIEELWNSHRNYWPGDLRLKLLRKVAAYSELLVGIFRVYHLGAFH
jgi:hypothetical protein